MHALPQHAKPGKQETMSYNYIDALLYAGFVPVFRCVMRNAPSKPSSLACAGMPNGHQQDCGTLYKQPMIAKKHFDCQLSPVVVVALKIEVNSYLV